jgi:hypothetical protein
VNHQSHSQNGARRRTLLLVIALLIAVGGYGARLAWRAHHNLVTLDVRDMDVRKVANKIEWQTWEDIYIHKEVQGKVTFKVVNAPLDEVMRILGGQTQSRPALFYALYSNGKSLTALERSLRGEVDPATHGWTNLQSRFFGGGGGAGFGMQAFGMPGQAQAAAPIATVSLDFDGKSVDFATLAFSRFAQTRVVPEDGVTTSVRLAVKQASVPDAVAQLAKAVRRKWTAVYALQGGFNFGRGVAGNEMGERPRGPRGEGEANRPGRGFGGPEFSQERMEEMRKQRETQEQELKLALPPVERQKYEQAQLERENAFRDMQNTTPEQMRERFTSQNSGAIDRAMKDRVLNSTPEQRAQMRQQMNQRRPGGPPR